MTYRIIYAGYFKEIGIVNTLTYRVAEMDEHKAKPLIRLLIIDSVIKVVQNRWK